MQHNDSPANEITGSAYERAWIAAIEAIYQKAQQSPPSGQELLLYLEQEDDLYFGVQIPQLLLSIQPPEDALALIETLKIATLEYKQHMQQAFGVVHKKQKINSAYLSNE